MRDILGPSTTLSYCTNVHPVHSFEDIKDQLALHASSVKARVSPFKPLAVGLCIPAADESLPPEAPMNMALLRSSLGEHDRNTRALRNFLDAEGIEPSTCNAFPYRNFHEPVVKHKVYQPDWTTPKRLIHTYAVVCFFRELQHAHSGGSISTLPLGWPSPRGTDPSVDQGRIRAAGANLRKLAELLGTSGDRAHRSATYTVDLEPEPGCLLDTADDVIRFFETELPDPNHRKHIGVCHDVCHAAVMFEDQAEVLKRYADAGIRVNKVQISSAIEADMRLLTPERAAEELRAFAEPRYLHQTSFVTHHDHGVDFELFEDLPQAIEQLEKGRTPSRVRVHFHVPIFMQSLGRLTTTQAQIVPAIRAARDLHDCKQFEVETYAWNVLPDEHKRETLAEGIADELQWVIDNAAQVTV